MDIVIHSLHFDADQKLEEFIHEKVGKLTQFSSDIISADVTLKISPTPTPENKIAEIKINLPGKPDLFAKKKAKSFEKAIDETSEALRRQLKKVKAKQRKIYK